MAINETPELARLVKAGMIRARGVAYEPGGGFKALMSAMRSSGTYRGRLVLGTHYVTEPSYGRDLTLVQWTGEVLMRGLGAAALREAAPILIENKGAVVRSHDGGVIYCRDCTMFGHAVMLGAWDAPGEFAVPPETSACHSPELEAALDQARLDEMVSSHVVTFVGGIKDGETACLSDDEWKRLIDGGIDATIKAHEDGDEASGEDYTVYADGYDPMSEYDPDKVSDYMADVVDGRKVLVACGPRIYVARVTISSAGPMVQCKFCGNTMLESEAGQHGGGYVGECCWDKYGLSGMEPMPGEAG